MIQIINHVSRLCNKAGGIEKALSDEEIFRLAIIPKSDCSKILNI
jgi:hypothetical protein